MKTIQITQGRSCMVDDEDFENLSKFKWGCFPHGNNFYAKRGVYDKEAYRNNEKNSITQRLMHREILGITDPRISIDHIDGDGLNNQKSNLRICSKSQNQGNRKKNLNGSSKYKGVMFHKRDKVFCASMKGIHIGSYNCEKEAALAYNVSASFYFREFARLNKI